MDISNSPLSGTPLAKVAQELYQAIDTAESPEVLRVLAALAHRLQPVLDDGLIPGIGREFDLWAGLKLDMSPMGLDYGEGIKNDYPEAFE